MSPAEPLPELGSEGCRAEPGGAAGPAVLPASGLPQTAWSRRPSRGELAGSKRVPSMVAQGGGRSTALPLSCRMTWDNFSLPPCV